MRPWWITTIASEEWGVNRSRRAGRIRICLLKGRFYLLNKECQIQHYSRGKFLYLCGQDKYAIGCWKNLGLSDGLKNSRRNSNWNLNRKCRYCHSRGRIAQGPRWFVIYSCLWCLCIAG